MRHRSLLPSFCKIAEGQCFQQQSKESGCLCSYPLPPSTQCIPLLPPRLLWMDLPWMLSEEVGRGREMRRVEPKGQEGGGKGRWCPGEGQLGWKEPRGVGLPSSSQIPREMGPLRLISSLHEVGKPYHGGSEGTQSKRPFLYPNTNNTL